MLRKKSGEKEKAKSLKSKQEKQIRLAIFVMLALILLIFFISFLIEHSKKFKYAGLQFVKGKKGNLILYQTKFPLRDMGGKVVAYLPFYFREDPRRLKRIEMDGTIKLKKTVALAANKEVIKSCEDSILAATTLSLFLSKSGINSFPATTNKSEAELYNRTYVSFGSSLEYSVLIFRNSEEGEESKIKKTGMWDVYILNFADCEIMNVTERFMLGLYAHSRGIEI
jgi:hypothetical protein